MENVECAQILLDHKKPKQAYGHWFFAAEEIGKIVLYSRCLKMNQAEREAAWDICRNEVEDHKRKLAEFLGLIDKFTKLDPKIFSPRLNIDLGSKTANDQLASLIQAHNDGHLEDMLHSFRECATFTTINNQRVVSPGRGIVKLPSGLLELVIKISGDQVNIY